MSITQDKKKFDLPLSKKKQEKTKKNNFINRLIIFLKIKKYDK
jgi:hypothetical protein